MKIKSIFSIVQHVLNVMLIALYVLRKRLDVADC